MAESDYSGSPSGQPGQQPSGEISEQRRAFLASIQRPLSPDLTDILPTVSINDSPRAPQTISLFADTPYHFGLGGWTLPEKGWLGVDTALFGLTLYLILHV